MPCLARLAWRGVATADPSRSALLRDYDAQLRTDAEVRSALTVERWGPLYLATFDGGSGFVTYRELTSIPPGDLHSLASSVTDHLRSNPAIGQIEWKTRGHDRAAGLDEALTSAGYLAGEPESIMIGELTSLDADVSLPRGVTVQAVTDAATIRAAVAMQDRVFGRPGRPGMAESLIADVEAGGTSELWVAAHDGDIVSAGRLEHVPGTSFVGLWGGATLPNWRGRGIYRALTAARARSALAAGYRLAHSDSTEFSRPILQRSGLVRVSTTTPYLWRRDETAGPAA